MRFKVYTTEFKNLGRTLRMTIYKPEDLHKMKKCTGGLLGSFNDELILMYCLIHQYMSLLYLIDTKNGCSNISAATIFYL